MSEPIDDPDAGTVTVNDGLRQELLALAEQEQAFLGAPEHDPNSDQDQRQLLELMGRLTRRLVEILDTHGWPGKSLVGEDGVEAAWTLALHTMHDPDVLRRCLTLMRAAAAAGEAEPSQVAFLVDRVSLIERGVQVYGTTICRQEDGSFGPPLLEGNGLPGVVMGACGVVGDQRGEVLQQGLDHPSVTEPHERRWPQGNAPGHTGSGPVSGAGAVSGWTAAR